MSRRWTVLAALGLISVLAPSASAQVAFQPTVSAFPNGVSLSTTPVVSADRRYVRLGVNPQFSAIEGFDTYSVPAAVSGGPGGPGALGGLGVGATFNAGMNGVVNGPNDYGYGYGASSGFNPGFIPFNSPNANAFLSGDGGIPARPRLSQYLNDAPRARTATRRTTKAGRSPKPRGRVDRTSPSPSGHIPATSALP